MQFHIRLAGLSRSSFTLDLLGSDSVQFHIRLAGLSRSGFTLDLLRSGFAQFHIRLAGLSQSSFTLDLLGSGFVQFHIRLAGLIAAPRLEVRLGARLVRLGTWGCRKTRVKQKHLIYIGIGLVPPPA